MKIVHVITGLGLGGAEVALCRLVAQLDRTQFSCEVIALTTDEPLGSRLHDMGIPVRCLHWRRSNPNPAALARLASWIRNSQPDVIHSWMYHANLAASLTNWLHHRAPVVWGIHSSDLPGEQARRTTIWTNIVCARLSPILADRILFCSEASLELHCAAGYPRDVACTIPNGFDTEEFRPDAEARKEIRRELGISNEAVVFGMTARFDPAKDHKNFLCAAAETFKRVPGVQFVLCGTGISQDNSDLMTWVRMNNLQKCVHLLGPRSDVQKIMTSVDVGCLSSASEAFPLTIGEAMACGTPVVATDVGDSRYIVGDAGMIVPPRDSEALGLAMIKMAVMSKSERETFGMCGRKRIQENFSIGAVAVKYQELYRSMWDAGRQSRRGTSAA